MAVPYYNSIGPFTKFCKEGINPREGIVSELKYCVPEPEN